jgi:aspartate/methionine/tyrosine aminotransferase
LLRALANPKALLYSPEPAGALAAREAVSRYYAARGVAVSPGQIVLSSSTSESYSWLFKLLCSPGDNILVPRPSYPLFDYLAALECVAVKQYPMRYDGAWAIDLREIEATVDERTRAVIVVNPNNPTGSFLKDGELAWLGALCRDRGAVLISDEVFSDFRFTRDPRKISTLAGRGDVQAFSLSGLSKVVGLPQMKLGWIIVNGSAEFSQACLGRLELIADTYLPVATPVALAAPYFLEAGAAVRDQILRRVSGNLDCLRSTSCEVLNVEGGWSAIVRVPRVKSEEQWCLELLGEDGVLVQPGYFFDFDTEAYLVVSLLTVPQDFIEGISRLARRVARCS